VHPRTQLGHNTIHRQPNITTNVPKNMATITIQPCKLTDSLCRHMETRRDCHYVYQLNHRTTYRYRGRQLGQMELSDIPRSESKIGYNQFQHTKSSRNSQETKDHILQRRKQQSLLLRTRQFNGPSYLPFKEI
jgi:hypothetical protein